MLWVKHCPPASRDGRGYIAVGPSNTTVKDGQFVKLDGVWAAAGGPSGRAGTPGYASANDIKWSMAASGDTWANPVYPFKRYQFAPESSDLTLDVATSGEQVVVFMAGEFETDQYNANITTDMSVGTLLYLDANYKLASGTQLATATYGKPVAQFLGFNNQSSTTFDSNYTASGMLWFRLLPPLAGVATITGADLIS